MTTETQDLKVGDRVRVVLEGEVTAPGQDGAFALYDGRARNGGSWINPSDAHVVSVERLAPPLPTTPGSVVRFSEDGRFAHLSDKGAWIADSGTTYPATAFRSASTAWGFDVLFDAGAGK